jgi:hypothetical protein
MSHSSPAALIVVRGDVGGSALRCEKLRLIPDSCPELLAVVDDNGLKAFAFLASAGTPFGRAGSRGH